MAIFQCPNGHKAQVNSDSFLAPAPKINYVWNAMLRDKNYKSDDATGAADPGACGLVRADSTGMDCKLYLSRNHVAPDTLVLLDGGVGDRSSFVGKALPEIATMYLAAYYSSYDWRDAAMREAFINRLPGVNYCHIGSTNGLRLDGACETLQRIPFHRLTIRKDDEGTTP